MVSQKNNPLGQFPLAHELLSKISLYGNGCKLRKIFCCKDEFPLPQWAKTSLDVLLYGGYCSVDDNQSINLTENGLSLLREYPFQFVYTGDTVVQKSHEQAMWKRAHTRAG